MTTALVPTVPGLTVDDLEALMWSHGGELIRNVRTNTCRLVGAVVDGDPMPPIGPVPFVEVAR